MQCFAVFCFIHTAKHCIFNTAKHCVKDVLAVLRKSCVRKMHKKPDAVEQTVKWGKSTKLEENLETLSGFKQLPHELEWQRCNVF